MWVALVDRAFCREVDELKKFKHVEIQKAKLVAKDEHPLGERVGHFFHLAQCLRAQLGPVSVCVAAHGGHSLQFLKHAGVHVDPSSLLEVPAQEFRSPLLGYVSMNGHMIAYFEVTIYQIRQIWKVKTCHSFLI